MSFGRRNNFMDPDFDGRRGRQQPADGQAAAGLAGGPANDSVPNGLLKTARQTGVLNLANRDLTHVPDKVWQVSNSTEAAAPGDLSLDRGDSGPRWWEVEEVRKLLLSANRLESLSDGVGQLQHLSVVDLRDNCLTRLPDALCSLQQLRSLNAAKNRLTELPSGLAAGCPDLAQLCVSSNCLAELPPDLGRLDALAELDASDNQLVSLPDSLAMLGALRTLEVGRNRLECLPAGLASLPGLSRLGAAGNQLIELPDGPYPALEVLDAADNRLTEPPLMQASSGCHHQLKELHLNNNRIRQLTLDRLVPLGQLRQLELRRNQLAELPAELPALLPQLERLDLTDNDLSSLPYELGRMDGLKCLLVEGNPMRALRREVLSRGTEAVKKHLASRIAGPAALEPPAVVAAATVELVAARLSPADGGGGGGEQPRKEAASAPKPLQSLQQDLNIDLAEVRSKRALKFTDRRAADLPGELLDLLADLQLARVDLSTNDFSDVPDRLTRPPFADTLLDLSLRQNRIADLSQGIGRLACLAVLDLSVNQLSGLPMELARLGCLRELVLAGNRFEAVPEAVYGLPKLENLLLGNNRIATLDTDRLRAMPALGTLDLTNNSLATVPPALGLCGHLRNLHLEGNLFKVPRPAQLAKGSAFVLEYLRNRIEG